MMNNDFRKIVRYASQAPSGHNTQPWYFQISDDSIAILPNYEAALPVVDHNNRELFISLGCAAENLSIAAIHLGYTPQITTCNTEKIEIGLIRENKTVGDELFAQIEKRQTNRRLYNGERIPHETLEKIKAVRKEPHIQLYFIERKNELTKTLKEYISEGNTVQMNDKAFKAELLSWMRFNAKQIKERQDGLTYQTFGSPALPQCMARPIVSLFLKPQPQNQSDMKKIDSSSHLIVCTSHNDTFEQWISLGRTLQRLLLTATEAGVSYAFLNQPCEVSALAAGLQKVLPVNNEYPTLILRIGYAEPAPYSHRKEIERILI